MAESPICGACRAPISDGDRFCRRCGAVLAGRDHVEPEGRKNVAVLFVDLVGSTTMAEQLDPEVVRGVLDRYYQACAESIGDHGGAIEKYIGDAIMAVFGVPTSHEDDAVRAVRAAHAAVTAVHALSAAVAGFGIELRAHAGVGSGEVVVVATPGTHLRIIGDPVNTAARLQSAAGPGEILVNAEVAHLVRAHATLEPVPPLTLKGKADPVPAWRVASLLTATTAVDRIPLVGRRRELADLEFWYHAVLSDRGCRRTLISGPAGIGKSRLLREFLAGRDALEATVLVGGCQPYGKDITYQPLASMLRGSLAEPVRQLAGDDEAGRRAGRVLDAILGGSAAERARVGTEDIAWATGQLLGALAARRPLVLVWEDLQWAEPTLLKLIDDLAVRLGPLPVLLVCVARSEINGWAAQDWDCRLELAPLDPAETTRLVGALVAGEAEVQGQAQLVEPVAMERIVRSCEGNPLFATVMADTLAEDVTLANLPPTVSAVLRARIDALPRGERLVLQMATVCGRDFAPAQLAALAGPGAGAELDSALGRLTRRGLVHQVSPGRYRFSQTLLHDTAYGTVPKGQRARWHAALAGAGQDGEIFHAETACLLYREISPDEPGLPALVTRTVGLLIAEGTVALHRKDLHAATALLRRGLALVPADATDRIVILLRLSDAYLLAGDSERALSVLGDGGAAGPRTLSLQHGIASLRLGLLSLSAARDRVDAYRAELAGAPYEHLDWCLLHQFDGLLALSRGNAGAAEADFRDALRRAVTLDDRYTQDRLQGALCELAQWSPTSVADGLGLCGELMARFADDRLLLLLVLTTRARLTALTGDFGAAYEILATARAHAAELNAALAEIAVTQADALVHALQGDHDRATELLGSAAAALRAHGHAVPARTLELYAVMERLRGGHVVAASTAFARLSQPSRPGDSGEEDGRARTWSGLVEARLACEDGRLDEALDRSGRTLAGIDTDDPCLLGDAWFEHAQLLRRAGRTGDAVDAAGRAERHFTLKGATHPATKVRRWVAAVRDDQGMR